MADNDQSDVTRGFWALSMSVGKMYSQTVQHPFHVSMAALYFVNFTQQQSTRPCYVKVFVGYRGNYYLLCTLSPPSLVQQPLDLNFNVGESVKFKVMCPEPAAQEWQVHLTGYHVEIADDDLEGLEGLSTLADGSAGQDYSLLLRSLTESSAEEKEESGGDNVNGTGEKQPKRKKKRLLDKDEKEKKKKKKKECTKFEEIKIGKGPVAQPDSRVYIYYVGTLEDGTEFCRHTTGKPLAFSLNDNSMLKGWHVGIPGMKVGGKRRLIVPPSEGYGDVTQGNVPAGSTLTYEIELKSVVAEE